VKDVDAVVDITPSTSHSPLLKLTAEAEKTVTLKSRWNVSKRPSGTRPVLARNLIVTGGTQHSQ